MDLGKFRFLPHWGPGLAGQHLSFFTKISSFSCMADEHRANSLLNDDIQSSILRTLRRMRQKRTGELIYWSLGTPQVLYTPPTPMYDISFFSMANEGAVFGTMTFSHQYCERSGDWDSIARIELRCSWAQLTWDLEIHIMKTGSVPH